MTWDIGFDQIVSAGGTLGYDTKPTLGPGNRAANTVDAFRFLIKFIEED